MGGIVHFGNVPLFIAAAFWGKKPAGILGGIQNSRCESLDILSGKVLRIGHMGNNANVEDMADTLEVLDKALRFLGFGIKYDIKSAFTESL